MKKYLLFMTLLCVGVVNAKNVEVQEHNENKQKIDENKLINCTKNWYLTQLGLGASVLGAYSAFCIKSSEWDVAAYEDRCRKNRYYKSRRENDVYSPYFYFSCEKAIGGMFAFLSACCAYKLLKSVQQRASEKSYDRRRFISIKEEKEKLGLFLSYVVMSIGNKAVSESFIDSQKGEVVGANMLLAGAALMYALSIVVAAKCTFDFDEEKKEELI